jgi:myo-inositol-1(or 4)-monophosphatase
MKHVNPKKALACAVAAARRAGALMRRNRRALKTIHSRSAHDIKLELDVRCQKLIEKMLLAQFPEAALLGEEGLAGPADFDWRWVVDPIDGTVNFTYDIPHACVSIALQKRVGGSFDTIVGVVYDPFCDEMWTAIRGQQAHLNGRTIHVSRRRELRQCIVSIGFAKDPDSLRVNLPVFNNLVRRVLKIRMMGAAALALVYVASGRFDAYIESGIYLWDIAAGGLILECAGGDFWHRPHPTGAKYEMLANNGLVRRKIQALARQARAAASKTKVPLRQKRQAIKALR